MSREYVYKISSRYLQKWLRYNIKHVKNRHFSRHFGTLPWFSEFCFLTDFDASKSVLGSFFAFFTKIWPKNMYRSFKSLFFFVWPFSPGDLRWPWIADNALDKPVMVIWFCLWRHCNCSCHWVLRVLWHKYRYRCCNIISHRIDTKFQHAILHLCMGMCVHSFALLLLRVAKILRGRKWGTRHAPQRLAGGAEAQRPPSWQNLCFFRQTSEDVDINGTIHFNRADVLGKGSNGTRVYK